jgi:hypothetical protein
MALAALFSAMEVIPLKLLTIDAWDFIKLGKGCCHVCGQQIPVLQKWTFYFMIAVESGISSVRVAYPKPNLTYKKSDLALL